MVSNFLVPDVWESYGPNKEINKIVDAQTCDRTDWNYSKIT